MSACPIGGRFYDELCLIMNSYVVLRISYRVKDKEQIKSKKVKGVGEFISFKWYETSHPMR